MTLLLLQLPEWVPAPISSMIRLLLQSSARKRLISATSHNIDRECSDDISSDISLSNAAQRSVINYDALRRHCMFASWNAAAATTTVASTTASENNVNNDCQQREDTSSNSSNNNGISTRYTLNNMHNIYQQSAVRVPLLHELCIRAVGKATLVLADAIAANGGIRPKQPIWMKVTEYNNLVTLYVTTAVSNVLFLLTALPTASLTIPRSCSYSTLSLSTTTIAWARSIQTVL